MVFGVLCRHRTRNSRRKATIDRPDYYVYETDEWLVFPHEINGLTPEEIRIHKPEAEIILQAGLLKEGS